MRATNGPSTILMESSKLLGSLGPTLARNSRAVC